MFETPRFVRAQDLFRSMELSRDFYFSYTYDLANTLQMNINAGIVGSSCVPAAEEGACVSPVRGVGRDDVRCQAGAPVDGGSSLRHRFVWNHHLLGRLLRRVGDRSWVVPLMHGFFQQVFDAACTAPACHLRPPSPYTSLVVLRNEGGGEVAEEVGGFGRGEWGYSQYILPNNGAGVPVVLRPLGHDYSTCAPLARLRRRAASQARVK